MWNLLEAEILVSRPLDIEYRDGFFHITDYYSDNCTVRRAIPPHIYLANLRRANVALAKWCSEQRRDAVLDFPIHKVAAT